MASGGKNYKIQCLSTFLSDKLYTKPQKVDIILKQNFLFCTVVSGLNIILSFNARIKQNKKTTTTPPPKLKT